jgi:transcriptional regulator with XRE-family HTH domain
MFDGRASPVVLITTTMNKPFYDPVKIQKKFSRAMALKGWDRSQLALNCKISGALVTRIFNGERSSIKTIAAMAEKLDVPLKSILMDDEDKVVA